MLGVMSGIPEVLMRQVVAQRSIDDVVLTVLGIIATRLSGMRAPILGRSSMARAPLHSIPWILSRACLRVESRWH